MADLTQAARVRRGFHRFALLWLIPFALLANVRIVLDLSRLGYPNFDFGMGVIFFGGLTGYALIAGIGWALSGFFSDKAPPEPWGGGEAE